VAAFWSGFRSLHIAVQIVAWLLFFPVVAALAITRGQREPISRVAVGIVVLTVTTPIWLAAAFGGNTSGPAPEPTPETTTEVEAEPEPAVDEPEADSGVSDEDSQPDEAPALDEQPQPPPQPDASSNQARAPPEETDGGILVSVLLGQLTVAPEEPGGYDRSLFRHWITTNGCTTRAHVLIRDSNGTAVTDSNCTVTAGLWYSPFDDVWVDVPRSIDIDHFVPLAEAWRSGARHWDEPTRRAFANDLSDPRSLIAVTASSNRSKSDRDPANWLPPNTAYRCDYVGTWVAIKHRWELSIDAGEKSAIQRTLDGCGELRTSPTAAARPASRAPTPSPTPAPTPAPAPSPIPDTSGCVNINAASSEDLQQIIHIGPTRAAELITLRPFASVDDLTRITGIGPARLADIKAQGLACVA
jgi:DNA uptake protein ComE-like DNA-binding protein